MGILLIVTNAGVKGAMSWRIGVRLKGCGEWWGEWYRLMRWIGGGGGG